MEFGRIRLPVLALILLAVIPQPARSGSEETRPSEQQDEPDYTVEERSHWSLVPRRRPSVPEFSDPAAQRWVRNPVDAFILAQLRAHRLAPSGEADRLTLIRRLTFDLTGLPPTPDELQRFLEDGLPDAYERLVDRLLASPHYGERWGQHWLDVVRFAESEGFEYDRHQPHAWRFRDWVVQSFNADKPYNEFVREQLAGDELAVDAEGQQQLDHLIAAGFHRLGPIRRNAGNPDVAFSRNEVLTEMTDIIGTAFLGLSIGCARCHDHMFDPIRQADYYHLQAFFASTQHDEVVLSPPSAVKQWERQSEAAQKEIARIKKRIAEADGDDETRLRALLSELEQRVPAPLPTIATVHDDPDQTTPVHLLERGDPDRPKQLLGMRVLGVLLPEGAADLPGDLSHPRSRLAEWIVEPAHPLTARVMVNRIWQYHFGLGLVETANDFGANGSPPSHPELLDFLANEFVASGWSIKHVHRLLLTSSTYRQTSSSQAELDTDPDNRWLWRFSRRRLQAEEVRDALLAVSGRLNQKQTGPSIMLPVDPTLIELLYKPGQWRVTEEAREHDRRSIYLIAKRNLRLPFLEVFDQPDLQTSCARREQSTHAPQALELLNGALANRLADAFAQRLREEAGTDCESIVKRAFLLVAGRPPTEDELRISREFLDEDGGDDVSLREFALAMFNLNALLYVE